jgi:hypothetical protein
MQFELNSNLINSIQIQLKKNEIQIDANENLFIVFIICDHGV